MGTTTLLVLIVGGLLVFWRIFIKFKKPKPLKTYNDYQSKAAELLLAKKFDQAIEIKLQALELDGLTNLQKGDLLYGIGGIYLEHRDYQSATDFFDQAFEIVAEEKIPYDKRYAEVLDAYVLAGRKTDAENLLESLLKRQNYNKQFKKLEKYKANG
jgi:tetratricopeptide (TPR) repeat protein